MRRPCWHFLQAGHSFTSSMRHPPSPDPPLLPALHAGPAVAGPEHLREIVDSIEVFRLVARLPGERSEEHTSELQSLAYLVCRLLLEKKKKQSRPVKIAVHTSFS